MIDNMHTDDLTWTAFRYVSGEMSADEAEVFELLLTDEQSYRDAVVRAVELSSTVATVLPQSKPSRPSRTTEPARRNWVLAATSAACVVLGLIVFSQVRLSSPDSTSSQSTVSLDGSSRASRLLEMWTAKDVEHGTTTSDDASSDSNFADAEELDSLTVPGWMIAAVTHEVDNEESDAEYPREMN